EYAALARMDRSRASSRIDHACGRHHRVRSRRAWGRRRVPHTMLVGLAASLAMILTNLLLSVSGKTQESFAVMDPMRFAAGYPDRCGIHRRRPRRRRCG